MKVGYARVSSNTQDLALQTQELLKAGCEKIYSESISGKDNNRPELLVMIESLSGLGEQWRLFCASVGGGTRAG